MKHNIIFKKINSTIFSSVNTKSIVTINNMNKNLIKSEYQVRGTVVIKSAEIAEKLKDSNNNYPFSKLTPLNIGNPQALKQLPLTFPREVIGSVYSNVSFNKDAIKRADTYKRELKSIENYTHFCGMNFVRNNIANFIQIRDQIEDISKNDLILTNGAGGGIKLVLETLIDSENDAVMVPIPQYPLYSALLKLMDYQFAGYYLDESKGWSLDIDNLQATYKNYHDKGKTMKAFVIINPGNPTGNVLSK